MQHAVPPAAGGPFSLRRPGAQLVLASFVVLFQELALIRWLPSQVRVLAYFPNVVLISAFLGLGIGCLRAGKKSLITLWPISLAVLVALAWGLGHIAFTQESVSEHLWLLYYDIPNAPVIKEVRVPIVLFFILCGISFVPLGQYVAERLREFREQQASLWGYTFDLLGSLIGTIAFAVASFLRTFPVVWFSVIAALGIVLVFRGRDRAVRIMCLIAVVLLVHFAEKAEFYSPYYALKTGNVPINDTGTEILTNGSLHQYAAPIGNSHTKLGLYDDTIFKGYRVPYEKLGRRPREVLILGAGSGNDIQVALDEGADHIDAVEIDPVIQGLGRTIHPDKPYLSPKVSAINTDAREYLNKTTKKYDLIVFGTLDSMTRLSALSGVRLDNFVYTVDCLRAARSRLTADGGVMMYFMVGADYINFKLQRMLTEAFGESPRLILGRYLLFNEVFLAGPAFAALPPTDFSLEPDMQERFEQAEVPSDDWPYLYLNGRTVSPFYLTLIGAFVLLAVAAVRVAAPEMFARRGGAGFDAEMFLFGVAFLLLETKSVTEMNLVWGVTWLTSAVVFGSILFMLLVSTVVMQLLPLPMIVCAAGLVISLAASYFVPTHALLGHDWAMTLVLSGLFIGLPIFFASLCFALRFKTRPMPDVAFGWNLIGAVAGGLIEFSSMAIGFRNLALVALAAYLIAFAISARANAGPGRPATMNDPAIDPPIDPTVDPTIGPAHAVDPVSVPAL